MAKQVVIDWQPGGLIMAVGAKRGDGVALDRIAQQTIGDVGAESSVTPVEAMRLVASAVNAGKSEAVVIASRELVELRTLAVPKVDPDELPDVIRLQAQRQFANISDGWALDYVMLPVAAGQELQTALVAAISPTQLEHIQKACEAANLQVAHLALRPVEIARYALESGKLGRAGVALIVCLSQKSAEFLILHDGQLIQVRGTNLPEETDSWARILKGEIRRSLMAASSQLSGATISEALLIADGALANHVREAIEEATEAGVSTMDPIAMLPADLEDSPELVKGASHRLAAIAGAMSFTAADKASKIDFKNPKKAPPKRKNSRLMILGGAAAAALVVGIVSWYFTTSAALDADLEYYRNEVALNQDNIEASERKIEELRQVEEFLAGSPNWLDELAYIAERIPPADQILLESPTFTALRDGRGQISVSVLADSSSSISAFDDALSGPNHIVRSDDNVELQDPLGIYRWRARETILIDGRGWDPFEEQSSQESSGGANEPTESEASEMPPSGEDTQDNQQAERAGEANASEDRDSERAGDASSAARAAEPSDAGDEEAGPVTSEEPSEAASQLERGEEESPSDQNADEDEPANPIPDDSKITSGGSSRSSDS